MKRTASAIWQGGLKDGKGSISTESGVLSETQYSFATRFVLDKCPSDTYFSGGIILVIADRLPNSRFS